MNRIQPIKKKTKEIEIMAEEKKPLVRMYWIHALTPLHVGAGTGVGFIDLPIMREKTTAWPVLPGSAVKGVLADDGGDAKIGRAHV